MGVFLMILFPAFTCVMVVLWLYQVEARLSALEKRKRR